MDAGGSPFHTPMLQQGRSPTVAPGWPGASREAWQGGDVICVLFDVDQPAGREVRSLLQACGLEVHIGPHGFAERPGAEVEVVLVGATQSLSIAEIRARLSCWRRILPYARVLLLPVPDAEFATPMPARQAASVALFPTPSASAGDARSCVSPCGLGSLAVTGADRSKGQRPPVCAPAVASAIESILQDAGLVFWTFHEGALEDPRCCRDGTSC